MSAEQAWLSQLDHGALLLNTNNFTVTKTQTALPPEWSKTKTRAFRYPKNRQKQEHCPKHKTGQTSPFPALFLLLLDENQDNHRLALPFDSTQPGAILPPYWAASRSPSTWQALCLLPNSRSVQLWSRYVPTESGWLNGINSLDWILAWKSKSSVRDILGRITEIWI